MPNKFIVTLRKRLKPKSISMSGVKISTDESIVTKEIRKTIYREDYEAAEAELVRKHLRADDRVLEIGGGIGFISLLCAKRCGVENVRTYEPNPKAVAAIRHNYLLNGMEPNLVEAVMTTADGEMEFFINDNILSSSLAEREGGIPHTVTAHSFERVAEEFSPTVVVMDVEGAETDLLPASAAAGVRAILAELHPRIVGQQVIDDLIQQMADLGYPITSKIGSRVAMFERA
ncbi:FkbM family methyltransferase [Rhizobiaceae bacterium]|nr:FkbM family methyltransferase [Rhizobiaceae bacterium]